MDHVGGLAKVALRREAAAERLKSSSATAMVECLETRFGENESPVYYFKEITTKELEESRIASRYMAVEPLRGSSSFGVMVINPIDNKVKVAKRLCTCKLCKIQIDSYENYEESEIIVHILNRPALRSTFDQEIEDVSHIEEPAEVLLKGVVVAVAADERHTDVVWFIKIEEEESVATDTLKDDYGNIIKAGQSYLKGKFLERISAGNKYRVAKKLTYFYRETIVYPFVQAVALKAGYLIRNEELCEIYAHVELNGGMSMF